MIPAVAISPRLVVELVLVLLLSVAVGTAVTYRALYQRSKSSVSEQLSAVREATATATRDAWATAYKEREAKLLSDTEAAKKVAQDSATRARKAETAMDKMQRDRNAEAKVNDCLGAPLSERTRERLRDLETDYGASPRPDTRKNPRPK